MALEQSSAASASPPSIAVVAGNPTLEVRESARLKEALAITEEMFASRPGFEAMCDPDDPDHPFVLITVSSRGTLRELVQRHIEWGDRVRHLNADLSLRLSILPVG